MDREKTYLFVNIKVENNYIIQLTIIKIIINMIN